MNHYLFRILPPFSSQEVEVELSEKGLKNIYHIEDSDTKQAWIGGFCHKALTSQKALLTEEKNPIDWETQWACFAKGFKEGKAHIDLSSFGSTKTLLLTPGAGFGDLSHPTTNLMLSLMKDYVPGHTIIDIGTGSGILTLASVLLGSPFGIGIDIDKKAIAHAKENAKLNQLSSQTKFSQTLPKKLPSNAIFLMNMILPEQIFFEPFRLNTYAKYWIVSGILKTQKKQYLDQTALWGWKKIEERSEGQWSGYIFSVL